MADGVQSIEEAFAAAKLEQQNGAAPEGVGAPPATPQPDPSPGDADHPSESDPEAQALIDSLVENPSDDPDGAPGLTPASVEFWTQQAEVNGEMITLGEMRNGYLRHSDYTKKTQALAEQRRESEEAIRMFESFQTDPSEFARAMAVEFGWLDHAATAPVTDIEIPRAPSQEEIDARLESMLEERVSSDPSVQEARRIEAAQLIDAEFDRIAASMKVSIPKELRQALIVEAQQRQVYDFELLLQARLAQRNQRTSDNLIRSGAARPQSGGGIGHEGDPVSVPTSIEEAWAQAKAEAGRS